MRRVFFAALCAALLASVQGTANAAHNGQLAAVSNGRHLVTFNPDGSNQRFLRATPNERERISGLAWSPDGNQLAFSYDDATQGPRIAVIDVRTAATRMVSDHEGPNAEGLLRDFAPAWLPDGRIAWRRVPRGISGGGTLMAAAPDGSGAQTLPIALSPDLLGVAWSPAGHVLHSQDGVRVTDLAGTTLNTFPLGSFHIDVAWSPDERWVVHGGGGSSSRLVLVDLADSSRRDLTPSVYRHYDSAPAWSPDGTTIVYSHAEPGEVGQVEQVRAVDFASGAQRTIPAGSGLRDFAWQPCVEGVTTSCSSPPPPACWPDGVKVDWPTPAPCSMPVGPVDLPRQAIPPRPSAPVLTVSGKPRLDRHGRTRLSARCDRACTVSLRVSTRLTTGRVVNGRLVKASAPAGGTLKLRLARGKLPPRRRAASARIVGTVVGEGGKRAINLRLSR